MVARTEGGSASSLGSVSLNKPEKNGTAQEAIKHKGLKMSVASFIKIASEFFAKCKAKIMAPAKQEKPGVRIEIPKSAIPLSEYSPEMEIFVPARENDEADPNEPGFGLTVLPLPEAELTSGVESTPALNRATYGSTTMTVFQPKKKISLPVAAPRLSLPAEARKTFSSLSVDKKCKMLLKTIQDFRSIFREKNASKIMAALNMSPSDFSKGIKTYEKAYDIFYEKYFNATYKTGCTQEGSTFDHVSSTHAAVVAEINRKFCGFDVGEVSTDALRQYAAIMAEINVAQTAIEPASGVPEKAPFKASAVAQRLAIPEIKTGNTATLRAKFSKL